MSDRHAEVLERRRHDQPCPDCRTTTLPQTPLEAIRRYEHIGRIPHVQRLEQQPGEKRIR